MSNELTRRRFLGITAPLRRWGCPLSCGPGIRCLPPGTGYVPPASPRAKLNFNLDWKFIREDVSGAEAPAFDDSKWTTVSTPHSFNDVDSFRKIISHGGGDRGHVQRALLVSQALQASGRACRPKGLPRVRRHAPGRRHLPQRQAGRPVRKRRHRLRHRHHRRACTSARRRTCWR